MMQLQVENSQVGVQCTTRGWCMSSVQAGRMLAATEHLCALLPYGQSSKGITGLVVVRMVSINMGNNNEPLLGIRHCLGSSCQEHTPTGCKSFSSMTCRVYRVLTTEQLQSQLASPASCQHNSACVHM